MNLHTDKAPLIRALNDKARTSFTGATIVVTAAFTALDEKLKARVLERVRTFSDFGEDNDPHKEHDMAFFEEGGERFFFKWDYYDRAMRLHSPDASDPSVTSRVLTIGLGSDY